MVLDQIAGLVGYGMVIRPLDERLRQKRVKTESLIIFELLLIISLKDKIFKDMYYNG